MVVFAAMCTRNSRSVISDDFSFVPFFISYSFFAIVLYIFISNGFLSSLQLFYFFFSRAFFAIFLFAMTFFEIILFLFICNSFFVIVLFLYNSFNSVKNIFSHLSSARSWCWTVFSAAIYLQLFDFFSFAIVFIQQEPIFSRSSSARSRCWTVFSALLGNRL